MTEKDESAKGERRHSDRIKKNFILTYYAKSDPEHKYEITQLKNLSLGGICCITSKTYAPETKIGLELKTPYISDTTYLEGIVLESHEKVKNIIYETRLKFEDLKPQAEFLLAKVIDYFLSGGKSHYE